MTWYIALKIPKKKVKSRNNNFLRTHLPKHFLRFRQNSECVHWQLIKLKVMQWWSSSTIGDAFRCSNCVIINQNIINLIPSSHMIWGYQLYIHVGEGWHYNAVFLEIWKFIAVNMHNDTGTVLQNWREKMSAWINW